MRNITAVVVLALLQACAANSGIVPLGSNSFMVSRQAATGFTGMGTLKAEALAEAGKQCGDRDVVIGDTAESRPPYIFGNYPRVEIQFSCE